MDLGLLPAKVVLVDLWNLVEICWRPAKSSDPERYDPAHIFRLNLQRKLDSLTLALGVSERSFIFAQDSYPAVKHKLYPPYKANRPRGWADGFNPLVAAEQRLRRKGGRFIVAPGHEAEDAISSFVRQVRQVPGLFSRREVVVVSTDRDLWTLLRLRERTRVYNPVTLHWVSLDDVQRAFWVSDPKNIPLAKALWGDRGDNVPNAFPWLQQRLLPAVESGDGSLEGFLSRMSPPEWAQDSLAQLRINWALVRLDDHAPVEWQKDEDV